MNETLFGRIRLGYIVIGSTRLDDWRRFGAAALGLHADLVSGDVLAFRVDDWQRRIIVREAADEDVVALGWQVDDEPSLATLQSRLRTRGIDMRDTTGKEAALRGVERFVAFTGPKRQTHELFTRPVRTDRPLAMLASGFVTGASGLGHAAITSRLPEAMIGFWQEVFDARVSDHIDARIDGIGLDISFLRLNERHHSLAIAATRGIHMDPIRTKVQHVNLEVSSLDDLTNAYVRCRELGYRVALGVGQHTNDRELSFYVVTPSGFEIEIGWNPIRVTDEANWAPTTHKGISIWGHTPQSHAVCDKARQFQRAVTSLGRPEFNPIVPGDGR